MKILILYSSKDGHTKKIANFIAKNLNKNNFCVVKNLHKNFNLNLKDYNKIIIGASVRYGYFSFKFYKFINLKLNILNQIPSFFYSVSLIARKKDTLNNNKYTKRFLQNTLWRPKISEVFAGALKYSKYNIFNKILIYFMFKIIKNNLNIKKNTEFTNWNKVDEFSKKIEKLK
ncbi:hemG [Wigglesworthia glossinidia endosymbiont of Glossina brevipalpis]|uniref:Protoporphyrinogen IX dehydrogenase [quinone] n=1 Tax=Wigglesworthia glossinidia brevipalpis TaxID=36870 RepID=Q8D378_WIGBR|nr:hemG [Wigglesworthia glossinidia endosymbiont of Glossina brevipalpis]